MRFVLSLDVGNDAMQTQGDIGRALRDLARDFHAGEDSLGCRFPAIGDSGPIRDANGNRVGSWHVDGGS